MNPKFKASIERLPGLQERLDGSQLRQRSNLGLLPQKGVYVFYENGRAIYVGRSNRLKARIQEHGRLSSSHNTAPFAFNLAKKAAQAQGVDVSRERSDLEKDTVFQQLFSEAKKRVCRMQVRVIGIPDPIRQTLFEVYAHLSLHTEFNDFDTH